MGPVVKTYGGFTSKRKGLPKFVVKGTLETTGNVFSALHIDNLKAIRGGDNLQPRTGKVTKSNTAREVQPTFDDSLDSTFDKILKSDKNKLSNEASLHLDSKKMYGLDSSNQCWTCGCIPTTNMAHHVLFECKEDSYFMDPSPRSKRIVARKLKQAAGKEKRRKKLKLQKSPVLKSLKKESPVKKEKPVRKAQFNANKGLISLPLRTEDAEPNLVLNVDNGIISPVRSPFKIPHYKGSWLCEKSSVFMTSTPDRYDKRPKFSMSPIFVDDSKKKVKDQESLIQLTEDVQNMNCNRNGENIYRALSALPEEVAEPHQEKKEISKKVRREPELIANSVQHEQTPTEGYCKVPPLNTDNVQSEQNGRHSEIECNTCADQSSNFTCTETSVVGPSQLHCPSGYITKRRMWRKTRRTAINLSVDMFRSITKSTFNKHSNVGGSLKHDKLQVVTSRNDKSFPHQKEQIFNQQHFSISLDIEEDICVQETKSQSNLAKSHANESNMECETTQKGDEMFVKDSNMDVSVHELSEELKVCLSLLSPKDRKKKSLFCNHDSDVDMFSGLSLEKSMYHSQSFKSNVCNLFREQICATPFSQSNCSVSGKLTKLSLKSLLTENMANPVMAESVKLLSKDASLRESLNGTGFIRETALRLDESIAKSLSVNEATAVKLLGSNEIVAMKSLNVDEPPRLNSILDVSKDNDVSFEVVLKPCYVKLHRCDTQTIANVTYASQSNMSVIGDDHQGESMAHSTEFLTESNHSTNFSLENNTSVTTVVKLPLSLLGKLDTITIRGRGSSEMSQSSLDSFVQIRKLLEQSVAKLEEMRIEDYEAAEEHHEISHADKNDLEFREVLSLCGQTEPLSFITCYPESMLPKCKKIGEGAYGEVFLYNAEKQKTVIKIIPIEGDIEINAAAQKKFGEIKPEIIVAQELSTLRKSKTGLNNCEIFNEVLAVRCVRGKYPQWLLDLWLAFDEDKGSDNDCPDVFDDNQLYIVLELAHGGQDLESYEFTSADQAEAAITQVAFALAVGESEIQFEHRDLHWGNVLIAPTKAKTAQVTLCGEKYKVATKGVKVSIIDFTMSRMTMPANGENMFYDFGHDEELFAAEGDYQCDIYRLMRERTRNNWSVYEPFTNILWLHYLLDKMCSMVAYRNQNTKIHQKAMVRLENMRDTVLAYSSATAFSSSEFFKSSRVK